MKVRVHFNLHRKDFSVVDPETRRVLYNTPAITLRDVEFRVSEKGRQRVIDRNVRSVHAYALGIVCVGPRNLEGLTPCTYNPYRIGHFHPVGYPEQAVWSARLAVFRGAICWIKPNP